MKELVAMFAALLGVAILIIIGAAIADQQRDPMNYDIYLEPGRKVMSVQMDENYHMFVTTRAAKPDEPPEIIRVSRYPNQFFWYIHESK